MRVFNLILLATALIFLAITASTATITVGPNDCSATAVNSAITAASDGDTVELTCTGIVTWTTTVSIPNTKGITLRVADGTNTPKESANFPLTISSSADPIMYVNIENNNSLTRVTGFKFTNTIASNYGAIYVRGRGTGKTGIGAYRVDNIYFTDIQLPHAGLHGTVTLNSSTGVMTGLLDNLTFHDCSYTDGYTIAVIEQWKYGGADWSYAGMNAWTRDFSFGSNDFVFIEDNLIENVSRYTRHLIMGIEGGKYVARYNTFDTQKDNSGVHTEQIDAHGNCICSTIGAGTRGGEIYNNTFKGGEIGYNLNIRGGNWLIYDNNFLTSTSSGRFIQFKEYRAGGSGYCTQCTTACTAQDPWYQCVTDSPSRYPLAQQITGTYLWNNLYGGSNQFPYVPTSGYMTHYIQADRDYFVSASKPAALSSYTPYTYPHPLRLLDQDGNTTINCQDLDNDGYNGTQNCPTGNDCNDNNASIHPGAIEVCDNKDNDCDGSVDEGFDVDGDVYKTCSSPPDCNDNDSSVHPGATEICGNGIDENCAGGDQSCLACSQGAIPSSGCKCGSTNYYFGYCCDGSYQTSSCSGMDYFWFEAENGTLASPMTKGTDSTASGGQYIYSPTSGSGTAKYALNISSVGDYVVWGRVIAPDSGRDSFYSSAETESEDIWDVFQTSSWAWDKINARNLQEDPRTFTFSIGTNTLTIRAREANTKLDKLLVTNDLAYSPTCTDLDGDGYGTGCTNGPDCNDADASVHATISCTFNGTACGSYQLCILNCPQPPAETCNDSIDNDCDSFVDCLDPNCSANTACTQCPVGQIRCNNVCVTPTCSSNTQCNDSNSLTSDVCVNAGTCNSSCSNTPYASCGELITTNCNCGGTIYDTGLCCNSTYRAQATCSSDAQCDDQNSLTNDTCLNAGTCSASCSNTSIQEPVCSDGQTISCVTFDLCAGTRTCVNAQWGDCMKDNPLCPIPEVCSEGETVSCTDSDGCPGTQTCISNAWTSCTKLDSRCPQAVGGMDIDSDGVPSSTDCNDSDKSIGLCTGCAVCSNQQCVAGTCPSTYCSEESDCRGEHYYSYPTTVSSECIVQAGLGTCTAKKCIPSISLNDERCTVPGHITQPPEIPGEITEKPPQIEGIMPIQIIAAAIILVAIAAIAIAWVLRSR